MITTLLLWLTFMSAVTSRDVLYACQYPGCECEDTSLHQHTLSLTCTLTASDNVSLIQRNVSINVTSVTLRCTEGQNDPAQLVESLQQDLVHVRALTVHGCVTSLSSMFQNRFYQLQRLSLHKVKLTDNVLGEIIPQRGRLEVLEITGSDVVLPPICSMVNMTQLILKNCHIININSTECNPNETMHLRNVDLSHNELVYIPNWIQRATYLSELHLQHNRIRVVPETSFHETVHIKSLDLSHNALTSLPGSLFSQLSALQHLNLSTNNLVSLPKSLLSNTTKLTRLDLSINRLRYLDANLFTSLHELNILNLSYNSLSYLLSSHLGNLQNLLYLDLGDNYFRNIPVLSAQKRLKVLELPNNMIKNILKSSLRGLSRLLAIGLRNNRLQTLPLQAVAVSKTLLNIDVSFNNISHIDYRSEVNVSLDLTVTDSLSVLSSVQVLHLNNNHLTDVYRLARVFTGLQTLLLQHNSLSAISSSDFPRSIQYLDLSNNQIRSIEVFMFTQYPHLIAVSVQNNYPYLTSLPTMKVGIDGNADPKPLMFISGNLFICNCKMAYLKTYYEDKSESFTFYSKYLPRFPDLANVQCITERNSTLRTLVNIPEEEFMCMDEDMICEITCGCCTGIKGSTCSCEHPCPSSCTCSQGGSLFGVYDYKVHCTNSSLSLVPKGIPPPTTYLHLENTNLTKLQKDEFLHWYELKRLFLYNSHISELNPGCFNGLSQLTHLYLYDNQIRHLTPEMMSGLGNVTHLYLQNNLLSSLEPETFSQLSELQVLDLSYNQLTRLSVEFLPDLPSTAIINVANNPISCSCPDMFATVPFFTIYGPNIAQIDSLSCVTSSNKTSNFSSRIDTESVNNISMTAERTMIKGFDMDICNRSKTFVNATRYDSQRFESDNRYAVTLSTISVLFIIAVVGAIILYRRRRELQAWVFVRFGVRVRSKNASLDETGRTYDAFVSYSSHDERLVVHELAPRLEEGRGERRGLRRYQLCLHYRDFPVGDSIADTIIESIEASKRTIMLLSDNFLESEWCRYEFQTAHHHVLKERSHRLIIVLLHDVDDRKLDPDLRVHLNEGNFLRYDDPWFWEKLYFALPDVQVDRKANGPEFQDYKEMPDNDWNVAYDENELEIKFENTELELKK